MARAALLLSALFRRTPAQSIEPIYHIDNVFDKVFDITGAIKEGADDFVHDPLQAGDTIFGAWSKRADILRDLETSVANIVQDTTAAVEQAAKDAIAAKLSDADKAEKVKAALRNGWKQWENTDMSQRLKEAKLNPTLSPGGAGLPSDFIDVAKLRETMESEVNELKKQLHAEHGSWSDKAYYGFELLRTFHSVYTAYTQHSEVIEEVNKSFPTLVVQADETLPELERGALNIVHRLSNELDITWSDFLRFACRLEKVFNRVQAIHTKFEQMQKDAAKSLWGAAFSTAFHSVGFFFQARQIPDLLKVGVAWPRWKAGVEAFLLGSNAINTGVHYYDYSKVQAPLDRAKQLLEDLTKVGDLFEKLDASCHTSAKDPFMHLNDGVNRWSVASWLSSSDRHSRGGAGGEL